MTYHEITKKMKDLTMTPSDWLWLDNYLKETGSSHVYDSQYVYDNLVNAYQEREASRLPKCDTYFGVCRYCGFGFKCGYKGFCGQQRKAS